MAKFKINLEVVVEGDDVDDAVTRTAIYLALNASAKRPTVTVPPQNPFEFPSPRDINMLELMGQNMFQKGDGMQNVILNVEPEEAWPAPPGVM